MEVFFVDDSQEKVRSFLAKKAMKRRLTEQKQQRTKKPEPRKKQTKDTRAQDAGDVHKVLLLSNAKSDLIPLERPLPSAKRTRSKSKWVVSNASCPNPVQAGRIAFRTSDIFSFIQSTIDMIGKVKFSKCKTAEELQRMQILALTYRGEAMKMARDQLSAAAICENTTTTTTNDNDNNMHASNVVAVPATHQSLSIESQFMIIMQLVLMDYFCFPAQVYAHFAASRELIRSFSASSMQRDVEPINRKPSFIRNRQLHQIVTAFECSHLGSESLVWDHSDVVNLRDHLQDFVSRISQFNLTPPLLSSSSTSSSTSSSPSPSSSLSLSNYEAENVYYKPRIDPQSLVWGCLTKIPERDGENFFSEFNGQLAIIIILCTIFMDYEPSMEVPRQCVSDLEDTLMTIGAEEALQSALNLAWMSAGGIGAPIETWRQRLWSTMGMLYVFRRQQEPEEENLLYRLDGQRDISKHEVKRVCLEFLAAKTPY